MEKTNNSKKSKYLIRMFTLIALICITQLSLYSQESSGEFDYKKSMNLKVLLIKADHLREVPEDLFRLTALEELTITGNEFTVLPVNIKKLISIRVLNISGTYVEVLPEELSRLLQLQEIHLNYERWQYRLDEIKRITKARIVLE